MNFSEISFLDKHSVKVEWNHTNAEQNIKQFEAKNQGWWQYAINH